MRSFCRHDIRSCRITIIKSLALPEDVDKQKSRPNRVFPECEGGKRQRHKIKNMHDERWWTRFEELLDYNNKHGDCLVPQHYSENIELGRWVCCQRQYYKAGKLVQERIQALEEIGFIWNAKDALWFSMLERFREFKAENNGSCYVVQNDDRYGNIGMWVTNQRSQYRYYFEGRRSCMTHERIELLEKEDFIWDQKEAYWCERLEELRQYNATHGDCSVPAIYEPNIALGHWISAQRAQHKRLQEGKNSNLDRGRLEKLAEVGFIWDPHDQFWNDRYEELKLYKEKYNHCLVPKGTEEHEQLGQWVSNQRRLAKMFFRGEKCGMTERRLELLDEIGFSWPDENDDIHGVASLSDFHETSLLESSVEMESNVEND